MMTTKPKTESTGGGDDVRNGMAEADVTARLEQSPLFKTFFATLDDSYNAVSDRLKRLEVQMDEAKRDMAMVTYLIAVRDGAELPPMGGAAKAVRAPRKATGARTTPSDGSGRGAIPAAVLHALTEAGKKGLTRADLIEKLQIADDKAGQTSVSNALSSGKRSGKFLHRDDGSYVLNA